MSTTVDRILPTQDAQLTIAGLIVYSTSRHSRQISEQLTDLPGVDVHAITPEGKLVVTIEELPGEKTMIKTIGAINNLDGVISTSLVYTHSIDWREE